MPVKAQIQTGFAPINGTKLYYEMAGAGPPLALLHAGIADSRMWDEQLTFFSKSYRVIRYDLRGFGQSPPGEVDFSHHQDLYYLMKNLEITAAHLIGVSLGAATALNFALTYPTLARSLVLVASREGLEKPSDALQRVWVDIDAIVEKGNIADAVEQELQLWVDGPRRKPEQVNLTVRESVRMMNTNNFSIPQGKGKSIPLEPSAFKCLEEVRAPTLIVSGLEDIPDVLQSTEQLALRIKGAKKILIPDAAHMVSMEAPDAFDQKVLEFLKNFA